MDKDVQRALGENWLSLVKRQPNSGELAPSIIVESGGIDFTLNGRTVLSVAPLHQSLGYRIAELDKEHDTVKVSHSMHTDIAGTVRHILEQFLINDLKSFLIKSI